MTRSETTSAVKRIVGTAETNQGSQPFAFDTGSGELTLGFDRPDPRPGEPMPDQLAALERALQERLGVGLKQTRVGELCCYDCGRWYHVMREPHTWSAGMCLSCSMDRSSDTFD